MSKAYADFHLFQCAFVNPTCVNLTHVTCEPLLTCATQWQCCVMHLAQLLAALFAK